MNGLRNFWQKLTAPNAADKDTARREHLTKVILLLMVMATSVFVLPILIGWSVGPFDLDSVATVLLIDLALIGAWWLTQCGYWRIGSYIAPTLSFLLGLRLTYSSDLMTTAPLIYVIAILSSAMLHGIKAQWVMLGLSIGTYLALGWIRGDRDPEQLTTVAITVTGSFVGIALLQWLSTSQLQRALAQARAYAAELRVEVAERKRAEDAARETATSFRNIFENSPVGIYRTTPDGRILMANPALVRLLGFSSFEKLADRDLEEGGYEPGHPRSVFKERIESEGQIIGFETAWVRDDGSILFILESATAVRDKDGNTLYYEGAIEDITKRKLVEKKLEQRATELVLLNDIGGKIAAVLDLDSLLERAARLVQESFGYHHVGLFTLDRDRNELVMRARAGAFAHLYPPDHRLKLGQGIVGWVAQQGERLLANDVRTNMRYVNLFPDLVPTQAELSVPIRVGDQVLGVLDVQSPQLHAFDENDAMVMETLADQIAVALENARLYEAVQRELTERSRAEAALQTYAARLEQSNRDLGDFVFVASHDLQEPLRKIQTFGDRLKLKYSDALGEKGHDYLTRMHNAADRMRNLLDALLSYSHAMTRTQIFVSVDLDQLVQVVLSDLESYIEQVDGRVEVGKLPTIEADPTQMRQLLQHLIGNGLKFHRPEEPPVVKVHGQHVKRPARQPNDPLTDSELCQIVVQDNGLGFDEKYLIRLFQVFQRLHGRNEYEGTGIGLATCRKIAERHGGSITATSTPGQGSTFIVTLPLTQPDGESVL